MIHAWYATEHRARVTEMSRAGLVVDRPTWNVAPAIACAASMPLVRAVLYALVVVLCSITDSVNFDPLTLADVRRSRFCVFLFFLGCSTRKATTSGKTERSCVTWRAQSLGCWLWGRCMRSRIRSSGGKPSMARRLCRPRTREKIGRAESMLHCQKSFEFVGFRLARVVDTIRGAGFDLVVTPLCIVPCSCGVADA